MGSEKPRFMFIDHAWGSFDPPGWDGVELKNGTILIIGHESILLFKDMESFLNCDEPMQSMCRDGVPVDTTQISDVDPEWRYPDKESWGWHRHPPEFSTGD